MKSVTGQVRWQVTGRKPTRNLPGAGVAALLAKGRTPRLSHKCSPVISAIQMAAQARTVRLSDTMRALNSTERAGLANAHFGGQGATPASSPMQGKTQAEIIEIEPRMKHGLNTEEITARQEPRPTGPTDGLGAKLALERQLWPDREPGCRAVSFGRPGGRGADRRRKRYRRIRTGGRAPTGRRLWKRGSFSPGDRGKWFSLAPRPRSNGHGRSLPFRSRRPRSPGSAPRRRARKRPDRWRVSPAKAHRGPFPLLRNLFP